MVAEYGPPTNCGKPRFLCMVILTVDVAWLLGYTVSYAITSSCKKYFYNFCQTHEDYLIIKIKDME